MVPIFNSITILVLVALVLILAFGCGVEPGAAYRIWIGNGQYGDCGRECPRIGSP